MSEEHKETEYTHYRIDFKNCVSFEEGDYTIVDSLDDVLAVLKMVDIDLDDASYDDDPDNKPAVTITGLGMTRSQFAEFVKSCEKR